VFASCSLVVPPDVGGSYAKAMATVVYVSEAKTCDGLLFPAKEREEDFK